MSVLNKIGFSPAHIDETLVSALPSGLRSDGQSYTLKYECMSEKPSPQAHTHTHTHANYTRALQLVNTETELPPIQSQLPQIHWSWSPLSRSSPHYASPEGHPALAFRAREQLKESEPPGLVKSRRLSVGQEHSIRIRLTALDSSASKGGFLPGIQDLTSRGGFYEEALPKRHFRNKTEEHHVPGAGGRRGATQSHG